MELLKSLSDLSKGSFALLQVDPFTGKLVNQNGEWIPSGEERYIIFDSEKSARDYASSELTRNPLLEWNLYDHLGQQIAVLNDKDALVAAAKPKPRGFWKKWFG